MIYHTLGINGLISVFGNAKFKLIVMCDLHCSLNDRADFCTVCHLLDKILIDKISNFLSIVLADQLY